MPDSGLGHSEANGPRCGFKHGEPLDDDDMWTPGEPESVSPTDPIANGSRWLEALRTIRDTDPVAAALDPDRAIRTAREALRDA